MASNLNAWSIIRSGLYGVLVGMAFALVATAIHGNLGNTSILVSAMLSGAGLGSVMGIALAWLRNFVRGV